MPINSNRKGKAGELELAHVLTDHDFPARRGQQYHGGPESHDVVCEIFNDDLKLLIECMVVEQLNLHKAMDKAVEDCAGKYKPVVMHKKKRTEWLASMRLEEYLDLMHELAVARAFDRLRREARECPEEGRGNFNG